MAHKAGCCDLRINENTPPTFRERRHRGLGEVSCYRLTATAALALRRAMFHLGIKAVALRRHEYPSLNDVDRCSAPRIDNIRFRRALHGRDPADGGPYPHPARGRSA